MSQREIADQPGIWVDQPEYTRLKNNDLAWRRIKHGEMHRLAERLGAELGEDIFEAIVERGHALLDALEPVAKRIKK